jgi:hypothetical protein
MNATNRLRMEKRMIRLAIAAGILILLAACAPGAPVTTGVAPAITPEVPSPAATEIPSPAPQSTPTQITSENPATDTSVPAETALAPTSTAAATLSEWDQVQQIVSSYRDRLDRESEGYNGLSTALEQPGANEDWCGGLNAAVADFNYVNDEESAQALVELQAAQGCP